jgi:hypothetical protein
MNFRLCLSSVAVAAALALTTSAAHADDEEQTPPPPAEKKVDQAGGTACSRPADGDFKRTFGLELNVLWPFFPGGITELRGMIPVLNADKRDWRGELLVGTYADFASRIIRKPEAGKTAVLAGKIGYRQFFVYGTHVEVSANVGWRHESARTDGNEFDALQARVWLLAGYQHEFSRAIYANVRGGFGVHLYRSDRFESEERIFVPGADVNLGVRF